MLSNSNLVHTGGAHAASPKLNRFAMALTREPISAQWKLISLRRKNTAYAAVNIPKMHPCAMAVIKHWIKKPVFIESTFVQNLCCAPTAVSSMKLKYLPSTF